MDPYVAQQFQYAQTEGWIPFFEAAAKDYDWPVALLMAIASRETNMRNIVGDGGHGYSLMQVDIRSFPDWCASGAWKNVDQSILKGTQVLEMKRTQIGSGVGKSLYIGGSSFTGKLFPDQDTLNRVSTACYNAGLWGYYAYSNGQDPDRFTTGHNYSADVWHRKVFFEQLLGVQA